MYGVTVRRRDINHDAINNSTPQLPVRTGCCAWARLRTRSDYGSLDFFATFFIKKKSRKNCILKKDRNYKSSFFVFDFQTGQVFNKSFHLDGGLVSNVRIFCIYKIILYNLLKYN